MTDEAFWGFSTMLTEHVMVQCMHVVSNDYVHFNFAQHVMSIKLCTFVRENISLFPVQAKQGEVARGTNPDTADTLPMDTLPEELEQPDTLLPDEHALRTPQQARSADMASPTLETRDPFVRELFRHRKKQKRHEGAEEESTTDDEIVEPVITHECVEEEAGRLLAAKIEHRKNEANM